MLFDNTKLCTSLRGFDKVELELFETVNDEIYDGFDRLYKEEYMPNHMEDKHKLFILNITRGIMNNYYYYDINNENLHCHESFKVLFLMIYNKDWESDVSMYEVFIAVIFSFYAHVLLDSYGNTPSIEDFCALLKIKKNEESYVKIQGIFYGIAFSDHPFYKEIRGRMLMPHLYDNMMFEYKL